MYIRTTTTLSINLSMTESLSTKIIGEIHSIEINGDLETLVVTYSYKSENGKLIKNDIIVFKGDEIDNLSSQITSLLPVNYTELSEREQMFYKYLNGFRVMMAETFGIPVGETEIVIPIIEPEEPEE